ncbi:MAG: hypothetical protein WC862_00510 [Patescibacteria group bacterium]
MYLSSLQKHIILRCFEKGGKIDRKIFREFYEKRESGAVAKYEEGIITNSLERLINKELLIGYGRRTPHKWFVTDVKLTRKGRERAREILASKQEKMRFVKK